MKASRVQAVVRRAEAAEAGLRDLMAVTMQQLSAEQWKAIESVVRDVRSLANPRAEIAEARVRELVKTIAALVEALTASGRVLSEAREMLDVFEDHGGHDGLGGKGYMATIDHMDDAQKTARAALALAEGV